MPSALPEGQPVPADSALPSAALAVIGERPFGIYVHVPYCASRCGYCDFNTYTPTELGGSSQRAARTGYAAAAMAEVRLARRVMGEVDLPVSTVFFGGGTPTVLPVDDLIAILRDIERQFGMTSDVEVTTEANPESVDLGYLEKLRAAGFTRISFGMQSAHPHVLRVLERAHSPGRAEQCVADAHAAGFEHVNLDLIYGTPGESDADWQVSLDAALAAGPGHISAYALIVEEGTRLAAQIRRGELPRPDDDVLADRYLAAEQILAEAGFGWYEISNWSRGQSTQCRHNLLYWTSGNWWGVGPGAHSHVAGVRWWNMKHPTRYIQALDGSRSPAQGREVLNVHAERMERVMLRLRLASGCPLAELSDSGRRAAIQAARNGLLDATALEDGQAVLTMRGRLLADAVIRELVP